MFLEASSLVLTILTYFLCRKLYLRWPVPVLNPILTTLVALVVMLSITHIPYTTYIGGSRFLTDMLGPATVAFAIPLYKNFHLVKRHAVELALCLSTGSIVAITTSFVFARAANLNAAIRESLVPRSVTTPIAMDISHALGGIPVLTAVFVIVTALVALVIGPFCIHWLRIQSSVARGMLLGMGAHGLGTSMAFEMGQVEGTFASLSMILAATISLFLAPPLFHLL